jgi:hypothetical protein
VEADIFFFLNFNFFWGDEKRKRGAKCPKGDIKSAFTENRKNYR